MPGDVCPRAQFGRTKSLLPLHAQPNLHTPHAQPHLNSPSHMHPLPANCHARQDPIPIGRPNWLSPRGCIGNAPAIRLHLPTSTLLGRRTPDTTHMTYSRYNAYDFPQGIRSEQYEPHCLWEDPRPLGEGTGLRTGSRLVTEHRPRHRSLRYTATLNL